MPEKIKDVKSPAGFARLMWRAPIWMYKLHLGWLMSGRFLLLHHTGRVSGQPRQNVLEVVGHDKASDVYRIAAGFGKGSDWYKNILKTPEVEIQVGRKKSLRTAVPLEPEKSGDAMVAYAHQHPRAAKELMQICGYKVDGTDKDYHILGRDIIPFIELHLRS